MKSIILRGHRWIIEGKSSLGDEYIQLRRVSIVSELRQRGQVASVIDVPREEVKKYLK